MNEPAPITESEFILKRFSDPFPFAPAEYAPALWVILVAVTLLVGLGFIIWMYIRDAKTARLWALPLAVLRFTVYLLLAGAFFLPAVQTWETAEKKSRVIVVLDISPSVTATADETGTVPGVKPPTRMQKIIDLLTDEQVKFVSRLLEKNPVHVYRFGTRLDDDGQTFEPGAANWSKAEWQAFATYDFKPWLLKGLSPAGQEAVRKTTAWKGDEPGSADWAIAWAKLPETETIPAELAKSDADSLTDARSRLEKRVDVARAIVLGTNLPDSLTTVVNRESANMVQGVIVFSDGRSNLGNETAFKTLRDRATREKIPIFTVAVGEARETVGITISDVQAPDRAPPDEQFKVIVEADGVGLADTEVDVKLGLYLPGRDPAKDAPDVELTQKLKFQGDTSPPHGTAEFVVDPEKLPDGLTEDSKKVGKKRQMKEGAWQAVAKIAKDKREVFEGDTHVSPPRTIQVIDRPLRILLFASAATREYQTLRTLLVREVQQNRAELCICLQSEGAKEGQAVQDIPPDRMLTKFPTRLDTTNKATDKPEDKFYNLNEFDLVIGFDPDWSELSADQIKYLQTWVDNLGGGFVYVAGPLNTFQLARADEGGRMRPLLDILPVLPDDIILIKTRPVPRTPRRLMLKPNPEFDVLKLDDDAGDDPVAGWEPFFTGKEKFQPNTTDPRANLNPTRGFFAYYPLKLTKPGATTLAEFLDVKDDGTADPKPWLVVTQPVRGRTAFVGSGEIWRFRPFNVDFYDRFWIKLARYAAANRDVRAARGRVLVNKDFTAGSQVRVQARLLAPNGAPYEQNALSPKYTIVQYAPDGSKLKESGPFELKAKKGGGDFDGYYSGQVLADPNKFPPGDSKYRIVIDVPDSPGDTITGEFALRKSDPELDNVRPDFAALELAASTLDEVRGKIKDPAVYEKLKGTDRDGTKVKLAFKLADADRVKLIPECIDATQQSFRNRGPVTDLWDRGIAFDIGGTTTLFGRTITVADQTVRIGWVMLVCIGLLSLEWMTRKLLRLA